MQQANQPLSVPTGSELHALYEFTDAIYRARSLDDVYRSALDVITRTLGCEKASILLFDTNGMMRFVAWRGLSDQYRMTLEGHSPWQPGDQDPAPIFVNDVRDTSEPVRIRDAILNEGIISLGFVPLTLEGGVIGKFMIYYGQRQRFEPHAQDLAISIARHLGFSIGRAWAEASREAALDDLRSSEARFRLMSEQAPVMIWMSDHHGHCLHLNRLSREFWNVDEGKVDQFDWTSTIHPEDVEHVGGRMRHAVASHQPVTLRGRYANADGDWRTLQTEARPRFSGDGRFLGMIGVNVDITEQESIARQRELMLAELNHRVKNTLAVVQAIAHQTFRGDRSSAPVAAFIGRLGVLARAHNMLSRVSWESTPLQDLAREVLAGSPANRNSIAIKGPAFVLPPKQALAVALALHELQTNALKYGALSVDGGTVSLHWQIAASKGVEIIWQEQGGPPVQKPRSRGFGTQMIEQGLAADLGGEVHLDFRPEGLVCKIEASTQGVLT